MPKDIPLDDLSIQTLLNALNHWRDHILAAMRSPDDPIGAELPALEALVAQLETFLGVGNG